jgi:flavin reductase (DIM6/NTAB) family NADH-FMN oxidoreductase RutF
MEEWPDRDMFEEAGHGNKPFGVRIPALVVTRARTGQLNFLTAMWFSPMGMEPSRMVVAIEKRSFTYEVMCDTGEFVMCAPSRAMMDILVMGGRVSGYDLDKWAAAGLTAVKPKHISVPLVREAVGNVEYRVLQQLPFDDRLDLFVGEALVAYMRKGAMEGELYKDCDPTAGDTDPLLFVGNKYDEQGKSLGKFHGMFSGIQSADYDSPLLKKYVTRR